MNSSFDFNWRRIPDDISADFAAITGFYGTSSTFATTNIPSGHQQMRGLQRAMVSGYSQTDRVAAGVTGIGELVLVRHEGSTARAYAYAVGSGSDGAYLGAEYKWNGHHYSTEGPFPTGDVFGRIPWPPCSTRDR